MGWTWTMATNFTNSGKIDRKAECDAMYTYGDVQRGAKVLRSSVVGSTYYAAVNAWDTTTGKNIVFAAICLTRTNQNDPNLDFGYKPMSEDMGPNEVRCPVKILDLLSPTDNETALYWRAKCREFHIKEKVRKMDVGASVRAMFGYDITWPSRDECVKAGEWAVFKKCKVGNQPPCWLKEGTFCRIQTSSLINNSLKLEVL